MQRGSGRTRQQQQQQRRFTFSCHPHTQGVGTTAMTSFKCGDSRSPKYSPIRPGSYALARSPPARTIDSFPGAREWNCACISAYTGKPISGGSLVALIDRTPRARIQSPLGAKKCPLGRCACKRGRRSGGGERNHADGLLEITHAEGKRRINS
jgi:hypothetical protein